jgi:hypothetical protein
MSNNLPESLYGLPIEETDTPTTATVAAIRFGNLSAYRSKQKYSAIVKPKGEGFDATCIELPEFTAFGITEESAVRALATMLQDFVNE